MKNIHLFETKDAYDAAKSGLILPTVSYIKNNQDVKYNPFNANGHDFVEIAGIKWATMNVGAKSIIDYDCLYFQWGDTQGYTKQDIKDGKKQFASDWSDYKWYDTSKKEITKYYSGDGKTVLELEDDAVHAAWGGSWRLPTKQEFETLLNAVTTAWTDSYNESGVAGTVCSAKTDTSTTLFFPACGSVVGGSVINVGSSACYCTKSLYKNSVTGSYLLLLSEYGEDYQYGTRYNGFTVRGVLDEK